MTETKDFVDLTVANIGVWHDVMPPNDVALDLVDILVAAIRDFSALRRTLRFEDEPASFEAALLAAAAVEVAQ